MVFGFLTIGPGEIAIIMVVALIIFGAEKLPDIGRQIGMAYKELNRLRGDLQQTFDIEQYTRFDMPDYTAPQGSTYTYTPPALIEAGDSSAEAESTQYTHGDSSAEAESTQYTHAVSHDDEAEVSYRVPDTDTTEAHNHEAATVVAQENITPGTPLQNGAEPAHSSAVPVSSVQPASQQA